MRVWFGQIYIEPGVSFPFSHHFQRRLSDAITALVQPSPMFLKKFGSDFKLMFNVSAKKGIERNEIKGPTVFMKTKDVEYTVFLPFEVITSTAEVPKTALTFLLRGVCSVLESLDIDTATVMQQEQSLIEQICSDTAMFV